MISIKLMLAYFIAIATLGFCTSIKWVEKNSNLVDQKKSTSTEYADKHCAHLDEMKRMPTKDKIAGDRIYDGLMRQGGKAIPCLISRITDTRVMPDPREVPHVRDFKVGDAALFMLHRITKIPFTDAMPEEVMKDWETDGVYAYFRYVESAKNRKIIKKWWQKKAKAIEGKKIDGHL